MQETIYKQSIYHYQDNNQYTSKKDFDDIIRVYLNNLSSKKRDKALVNQEQYELILKVLQEPKNTSVSTAQFRFWVKKMFQLITLRNGQQIVCHDNKPVAMKEQIYDILIWAHRQSHHGGRDKTSALVRRKFSWIPKELVARFVRYCPYCVTRRNGHLNTMFSNYPNDHLYHPLENNDIDNIPICYSPPLQSSLSSSPISSSSTYYPGYNSCCVPSPSTYNNNNDISDNNNNMDDRHSDTLLSSPENHPSSDDLLYPLPKLSISSTSASVYSDPSSSSSTNTTTTTLLSPNPEYSSTQINLYMDSNYYSLQQQQSNIHYLSTTLTNNNTMKENGYKFELASPTRSSSISSSTSSVDYYPQQQQLMYHFPPSNINDYHFLPNESKHQPSTNHHNHHLSNSDSSCLHESKQVPIAFDQHHNPLHLMPFV